MSDWLDSDFETVNGYLWPRDDTACRAVAFQEQAALEKVYPYVNDWSACVQAGGNCGVWPNALAQRFGAVYTFEPDPANFHCLAHNVSKRNVYKFHAALGDGLEQPTDLKRFEANCGAHQVSGTGAIPILCIDALHLPSCGLIYLDIEGYEPMALRGARQTILRCKPVIGIEQKGVSLVYGVTPEQIERAIEEIGYRKAYRHERDTVFVPC